jgi:type IV secretory pathway TraG/TraD family ATPase VirD4
MGRSHHVSGKQTYQKRPTMPADYAPWLICGTALIGILAYLGYQIGGGFPGGSPVVVLTSFATWTQAQKIIGVTLPGLLVLAGVALLVVRVGRGGGHHVHRKAKDLDAGHSMSYKAAELKVKAGKLASNDIAAGLLLARGVKPVVDLYTAWRDGVVAVMGPGAGKTTGMAVPYCLAAPGLLIATTNKRDLPDAIRGPREALGTFWCFDPQRIADYHADQPAPWWWNPLTYVTDETRALSLAKLFAEADADASDKKDPFFDKEGPLLLARLLLAAAAGNYHFPQVFIWLNKPKDRTPIQVLRDHGMALAAGALESAYNWPEEQKAGVFATSRAAVEFLDNRDALQWIAPLQEGVEDTRPEFHPTEFVKGRRDTVMSMSKEGDGSLGPITAALTKALLDAAEDYANRIGGGRMPVPLVAVLDEAANTCKIPNLPKKYSFYGGMGMFLVTILQNWTQGETAWGEKGMRQLWAAATHRVVGAGAEDVDFLERVTKRVGKQAIQRWTVSTSDGKNSHRSNSSTIHDEDIMSVSDLAELPFGTVIVLPSGSAAIMAVTVPWWERAPETKAAVEASLNAYKPKVVAVDGDLA